jgi:hypothetical protein
LALEALDFDTLHVFPVAHSRIDSSGLMLAYNHPATAGEVSIGILRILRRRLQFAEEEQL